MSTQQAVNVATQVSAGIRQIVTSHVLGDPTAVRRLAVGLDVPEARIQKALTVPDWDLNLSIDAAKGPRPRRPPDCGDRPGRGVPVMFEVRCPECGTSPRLCSVCGGRCCACYHDDEQAEPAAQ